MENVVKIVGEITFYGEKLPVYHSLQDPLFLAKDVGGIIGYSKTGISKMAYTIEPYQKLVLPVVRAGQKRAALFITETGLYSLLAQSRKPLARIWRDVITREIVGLRKKRKLNVVEQFEEWDRLVDDIFIDERTGKMMISVTIERGDVDQIPIEDYHEFNRARQAKYDAWLQTMEGRN